MGLGKAEKAPARHLIDTDLRDCGKVFIFPDMSYSTQAIAAHAFRASALLLLSSPLLAGLLLRASAN